MTDDKLDQANQRVTETGKLLVDSVIQNEVMKLMKQEFVLGYSRVRKPLTRREKLKHWFRRNFVHVIANEYESWTFVHVGPLYFMIDGDRS